MIKGISKDSLVKHVVVSVIIAASGFASVNGLSPFVYAIYYAATFSGLSPILLAPSLMVGAFCVAPSPAALFCAFTAALVTSVVYLVLGKNTSDIGLIIALLVVFLGQSAEIVLSWYSGVQIIHLVINLSLCYVFTYVGYSAIKPMLRGGARFNLIETEIASLFLLITVVAMSIASFPVRDKIPLFIVASLFIPTTSKLVGKGAGVMLGLSLGLGSAFATLEVTDIALFGLISLTTCAFISSPRALMPVVELFSVAVFELFFNVDYLSLGYHLGAMLVGSIAYAVIPLKVMNAISERFFRSHSGQAIRYVINRSKSRLSSGVSAVGRVFESINEVLVPSEKDDTCAAQAISGFVVDSVCKGCCRYDECLESGLLSAMEQLSKSAIAKGRASVSDVPPLLVDKCLYVSKIMCEVTSCAERERMAAQKRQENNRFTALLSNQMEGVSSILFEASRLVGGRLSFDYELEKRIIEELRYYGVVCSEALTCIGEQASVTLIVKREEAEREKRQIASVVSKLMRDCFAVSSVDDSLIAGWSVVELERAPTYDVVFGVASKPLSGHTTGDTHSFMKIGASRFLMAICDGMGAGRRAFELSNKAMTLVESFYRAGFSHEFAAASINRFLSFDDAEGFSALDLIVVDLKDCNIDIVKLASPPTYVKKKDSVIRVDGSSLPLGVTVEASPSVFQYHAEDGDIVVLASDGVSARFEGDSLSAFINNLSSANPQAIANGVLAEAERRTSSPEDDMTVAVCKVFMRHI